MRVVAAVVLVLGAAVAGCLAPSSGPDPGAGEGDAADPSVPEDWAKRALPDGQDHNHSRVDHHLDRSTPNFEQVGWDPLITDYHGSTSGGHLCGGVSDGDGRQIAVTHSFSSDVAFVVVDVSDPAQPVKLGEYVLPNTQTYDVDILPDASYAVVATSPLDTGPDEGPGLAVSRTLAPRFVDACGTVHEQQTEQVPYDSGVVLVDLSDPTDPEFADFASQPVLGAHSVFATTVDGTDYVLGSTTNLNHQSSYFTFWTVEETPGGGQLVEYGTFTAQYPGEPSSDQPPLVSGHVDGWIQAHPDTGQTLAYLANWDGGLVVVELAGQGDIMPVGRWNDYDPDAGTGMTGNIHEALPMPTLWTGTHYTFIGQELGGHPANRPTGQVIMLDTTDPSSPEPVARWTLPVDVDWSGGLQFSTHYIEVIDRTLFVSLYHGGVWAVDARPEAGPELPTEGVFLPTERSLKPPGDLADFDWTPVVLDVHALDEANRTLVTFDGTSGAYTLKWDPSVEVPTPDPWTEDAWIEG